MKKENQQLIAICKGIDLLEKAISKREFIKKLIDNIDDIVACDYCGKIVSASVGGIKWWRDGYFQVGMIRGRSASWCSDECEKHNNMQTTIRWDNFMTEQQWRDDIEMTIKSFLPYYEGKDDYFYMAKQADIDGVVKSLADYIIRKIIMEKRDEENSNLIME